MARKPAIEITATPQTVTLCKYAGDSGDEFCAACNGVTMMDNGVSINCTECGGYEKVEIETTEDHPTEYTGTTCSICQEPQFMTESGVTCANGHGGAEALEEMVPQVEEDINDVTAGQILVGDIKPPVVIKPTVVPDKKPVTTPAPKAPAKADVKPTKETVATPEIPREQVITPPPSVSIPTQPIISSAMVTEIKAESGISLEIQGRWYKFNYSETRVVSPYSNIEDERKKLWEEVNATVDNQVEETYLFVTAK